MKRFSWIIGIAVIASLIAACGDKQENDYKEPAPTVASVATIQPAAAEPMISPEMDDFISGFDGTYEAVEAALQKYGATEEIVNHDMGMYDLKDPEIVGSEGNCYSLVTTSGIFENTYEVCWEGSKIISITGG